MEEKIWREEAGRTFTREAYIALLQRTTLGAEYEAPHHSKGKKPGDEFLSDEGTWKPVPSDWTGYNSVTYLIRRKKEAPKMTEVKIEAKTLTRLEKSPMTDILRGAGTTIGIDLVVKTLTRKLARLAVNAGKYDIASLLISKEGRQGAKFIAPAALLGICMVLTDSENPSIKAAAEQMLPTLKVATSAGLATVGSGLIEKMLLDEEDDLEDIRSLIDGAKQATKPVAEAHKTI